MGRLISSREHRFNPRWLRRFPQVFHSAAIWNPAVAKGFCQGKGKSAFPLDAEAVRSGSFLVWLLRFAETLFSDCTFCFWSLLGGVTPLFDTVLVVMA